MITTFLTLFTLFFIGYSFYLYLGINAEDSLTRLRGKLTLGVLILFGLFVFALGFIYYDLSRDGYAFETEYQATINPTTKSVIVGRDKGCDIVLSNRFSDSEHVVFDFNEKPTVEIISKVRSAIVNQQLITLKEKKLTTELEAKKGDKLLLDGTPYELDYTDTTLILKEISHDFKLLRLYGKQFETTRIDGREIIIGQDAVADIQLDTNSSTPQYVAISFDEKKGKTELSIRLLTSEKDAYLNKRKMSFTKKKIIKETGIKNDDIIRLGYSDYRVSFDEQTIRLENIFFSPSIVNLFNIYTTTTIPNLSRDVQYGGVSLWWIFWLTIMIVGMMSSMILISINKLADKFSVMGERRFILYPLFYFSFFLTYLLMASMVNFTVLQYHQFSVYNKGALYTVLLVYILILFNIYLARLGYAKNIKSTMTALLIITTVVALPMLNIEYIYTSRYLFGIHKSILFTALDLGFIFLIFGFGFGRLVKNLQSKEQALFVDQQVNIRLIVKLLAWSIVVAFAGLFVSFVLSEGAGIVVIETIKLFIFYLFTVILLDAFQDKNNKVGFSFWIAVVFVFLLIAIVLGLKDMGSLIQVSIAMGIISLFFYNRLKKINFINKWAILVFVILLSIGVYFVVGYIHDNIRLDMWIEPFAQTLEVKNQFYMYYYEQIARGLYLIKQASFFPSDFTTQTYMPLPNLHTDFIFALYVNVFGMLGFFAIIVAFVITILSFDGSIHLFQDSKKDIYRFIYGVNVIFIAYIFSYIIINMLSVMQVFPLTDVPFPIMTYARGVLVLFFVLYAFVGLVNYLYLDYVSHEFKGRV